MAYRAPIYSHVHAARDVGASEISLDGDTAHADFPIRNMIDDRAETLFKFSASVVDPKIDIDLGASFVTGLDRLIIPADHNIDTLKIIQDTVSNFASPETLHDTDTGPAPGTLYDSGTFDTAAQDQRYVRIEITGTLQFQIPQLVLTEIETLTVGPNIAASTDAKRANVTRLEQQTGLRPTIQHGPQQRIIEYDYESPLSGADLTAMEAFIAAVGTSKPFYVDPASFSTPPEDDEPALVMKFAEMPLQRNSILVPMSGARSKTFDLSLVESLD